MARTPFFLSIEIMFLFVFILRATRCDALRPYYLNIAGPGFQNWSSIENIAPNVINNEVVLLTTWFGVYPCLQDNGKKWCNGGIPQLANLTLHREVIAQDLDLMKIPQNFSGYFVNDYESWHLCWDVTPSLYKTASYNYALSRNHGTVAQIWKIAQEEYTAAAVLFLRTTLQAVRAARPYAKGYGFYGYPSLYTFWGNGSMAQACNDQSGSLWEVMTGFYPSIYLPYMSNVDVKYALNYNYIERQVGEALRVRAHQKKKMMKKMKKGEREENNKTEKPQQDDEDVEKISVFPYSWYRYHPGEPHALQFLDPLDLFLEFDVPFGVKPLNLSYSSTILTSSLKTKTKNSPIITLNNLEKDYQAGEKEEEGIDGLIIWGSEATSTNAEATRNFLVKNKNVFVNETTTRSRSSSIILQSTSTGPSGERRTERMIKEFTATTRSTVKKMSFPPPFQRCGL